MDRFRDIRPYHDDEIRPVLDGLLRCDEFVRSIAAFSAGRLYRALPPVAIWLVRRQLAAQLAGVNSVASMQDVIAGYMDKMIERTTTQLSHSGLDELTTGKARLFVSNHRDIAMDPAFVNYMLYHAGFPTVYIAIGDNLLKRPFVTDLMRLNKSFIVRRSLKGRELLQSSMLLSEYMHHLVAEGNNVWIAQREGRAKDGIDRTETALVKMLSMARRKEGAAQALRALNIVPVSISYEFDPCDRLKAEELHQKATCGTFKKDEHSDINSIVTGMMGFKGHVHVSFGTELNPSSDDAEEIARQIDSQIINNYRLQGTNFLALEMLWELQPDLVPELKSVPETVINSDSRHRFEQRINEAPEEVQVWMLQMYANPVIRRYGIT